MSAPAASALAYARARQCLQIAREHLADCRVSLWSQKVKEACYWRQRARELRR